MHDDGCERSYSDRHSQSEDNDRGEKRLPIITSHRRCREQNEAQGHNKRTKNQWSPRAICGNKSARPARKKEHKQNEGKNCSASCRGGISLDLDQVQRKQEKENSDGGI